MPMIKRNEGKIRSAGVRPVHSACSRYHGILLPPQSTMIIPNMVKPLYTSKESSLTVGWDGKFFDMFFSTFSYKIVCYYREMVSREMREVCISVDV